MRAVLVAVYLLLAVAGLGLVARRGGLEAIARLFVGPGAGASAAFGLAVAAVVLLYCQAGWHTVRWLRRLGRVVRRLFGPLAVAEAVWVGLLTGLAEELFFRAGLQPDLGLLATSVLFGGLHVLPPLRRNWPWTVVAFAVGLALGGIYQHTSNLLGPVLGHALINAVNLARIGRL